MPSGKALHWDHPTQYSQPLASVSPEYRYYSSSSNCCLGNGDSHRPTCQAWADGNREVKSRTLVRPVTGRSEDEPCRTAGLLVAGGKRATRRCQTDVRGARAFRDIPPIMTCQRPDSGEYVHVHDCTEVVQYRTCHGATATRSSRVLITARGNSLQWTYGSPLG